MIGWSEIENGGVLANAAVMDWITGSGSTAVAAATAGKFVVMTPNTNCYINYYMSTNLAFEPYFNSASYLTLSTAYNFEPIPVGLPAQYAAFILGADCNEWAEYIPSLENAQFKAYPRLCALSEVTWTAATLKNYAGFIQRLATHEVRLAQMGVNYDATNAVAIGAWSAPVSTSPTTVDYDITGLVTKAGEIDVNFYYTSGTDGLWIYSAALLENGVQVDLDTYTGFAGASFTQLPVFVLHLPAFKAGATYTIQASIAGRGGTASNGTVYLTNWN